jgi:hypothetical protein
MQAEYLRSIRSPPIASNFKVPVPKQRHKSELSHLSNLEEEDESYAEVKIWFSDHDKVIFKVATSFQDSFCVTHESSGENTEDSLELLEKQLEMKEKARKNSKALKENLPEFLNAKKKQMRRVIAPASSDR